MYNLLNLIKNDKIDEFLVKTKKAIKKTLKKINNSLSLNN